MGQINNVRILSKETGATLGQHLLKLDFKHTDNKYAERVRNNSRRLTAPYKYFDIVWIEIVSVKLIKENAAGQAVIVFNEGLKDNFDKSLEVRVVIGDKTSLDEIFSPVTNDNIKRAISALENKESESIVFADSIALTKAVNELNNDIKQEMNDFAMDLLAQAKMIGNANTAMCAACNANMKELGIEPAFPA